MTIKKIHFISGLTITIFIGLHLFNHFCSIFGADKHIGIMNVLRHFYRNIFVEAILLLAVLVQIISGLNSFPFNLFFIPYYGLAILSFFGHIASIHNKKMKTNILSLTPKEQAKAIIVFGLILTISIFYGLTNHFQGVTVPKEYNILIGK